MTKEAMKENTGEELWAWSEILSKSKVAAGGGGFNNIHLMNLKIETFVRFYLHILPFTAISVFFLLNKNFGEDMYGLNAYNFFFILLFIAYRIYQTELLFG